jgi:hypothetical protein
MKKNLGTLITLILLTSIIHAQGPNRTFGKFKKQKGETELSCTTNCATIILVYEKGTYINTVKAALGIDDTYAIASDKAYYVELKIPAGKHKISLPQGINDGATIHKVEKGDCENSEFICLNSMYSDWENYQIMLGKDIFNLEYNLTNVSYTNKIFARQINCLTYERNFEAGKTYYFKTIKLAKGLSLSCGPLITETTKDDFEAIINGKNIKKKGEAIIYMNPEK